jgi:hypothetical protein
MDAVLVSLPKPRLADRIGYVKKVQLMGKPSAFEYFAQPLALVQCIGREVHYNRLAGAQQGLDVVFLHFAQTGGTARAIFQQRDLSRAHTQQPVVLTDKCRGRRRCQAVNKSRFSGSYFTVDQMQGWFRF